MVQAKGLVLDNVRAQINNLDVVAAKVHGKGVRNPEDYGDGYYVKMKF